MEAWLIDGHSFIYRSFHALRDLRDSKGNPTNAIFGFTKTIVKLLDTKKPSEVAVMFDSKGPTERHGLFEDYKANRPDTPDELIPQIEPIKRIVRALGVSSYELRGFEADDLLGTVASKVSENGGSVYIVTGDKDMLQLVSDKVKIYDPVKDRVLDTDYIRERYAIEPSQMVDFMALTGDAIDNIPGVKGIGEKTAKKLLSEFRDLDTLLGSTDKIRNERVRKMVQEGRESALLSRELARVNLKVPLKFTLKELVAGPRDTEALRELFLEHEFYTLARDLPKKQADTEGTYDCLCIESVEELDSPLSADFQEFAFDTETTSAKPLDAELTGISFSTGGQRAYYIPIAHSGENTHLIDKEKAIEALKPVLENRSIIKTGHNLKYDIKVLSKYGVRVSGPLMDTMVASYLLNPTRARQSLENVSMEFLGRTKKSFAEVAGKDGMFADVPLKDASRYACLDSELALELGRTLNEALINEGLDRLSKEIEMPLIGVLSDMELTGVMIDSGKLGEFSLELETELASLTKRIYFLAGREFNINSPKQLGEVLFDELGLTPSKKKKTGYSTDISVLEELSLVHELPAEVLGYRKLNKLKSTYVDVLPRLVHPETSRVHTSFNQTVTATGRLSSSEPNLQNIPIRGTHGTRIREAFVAPEGSVLLGADYSQIELRVLALLCRDEALLQAFRNGSDIHTETAARIFGVSPDRVDTEMRRAAKGVNFGVIYGITPYGLSAAIGVSREQSSAYIERYFEKHPGVKMFMDRVLQDARRLGYVKTLFGRVRSLPELKNPRTRQFAERMALNTPVQGTAADIIKLAMIDIHGALIKGSYKSRMILQVHDELLLECPEEELMSVKSLVVERMRTVLAYSKDLITNDSSIPGVQEIDRKFFASEELKVDFGSGRNWAEAH